MAKSPLPKRQGSIGSVLLTAKGMAEFLGMKQTWFHGLVKQGILPKVAAGAYSPSEVTQSYIAHLKENTAKPPASSSLDDLRELKAQEIRLSMAKKDRELIALEEAVGAIEEITGLFNAYLSGLPAEITRNVRERQRIDEIIDIGKQRLSDRFAKKTRALLKGFDPDEATSEDDAN